jgi:MgtC family
MAWYADRQTDNSPDTGGIPSDGRGSKGKLPTHGEGGRSQTDQTHGPYSRRSISRFAFVSNGRPQDYGSDHTPSKILVSLGSCFYTISSSMAFQSSTQTWDASRVTAALPSGVGFLGGAIIWKGSVFLGNHEIHQVHGLTTAASLWLSAAVGVGVGGALYALTVYVTIFGDYDTTIRTPDIRGDSPRGYRRRRGQRGTT